MKKILFIVHKSSERAFQDCINSINELKKPMLFNTMLVTYDDNGVSAVSNAYLEACRTENPDISIIMDDTVLLVNEKCLREIIDIFKSDSQIGVIGVKGADCLLDSGNIDEAKNLYGGFYEMNCQGEVFEKIWYCIFYLSSSGGSFQYAVGSTRLYSCMEWNKW